MRGTLKTILIPVPSKIQLPDTALKSALLGLKHVRNEATKLFILGGHENEYTPLRTIIAPLQAITIDFWTCYST